MPHNSCDEPFNDDMVDRVRLHLDQTVCTLNSGNKFTYTLPQGYKVRKFRVDFVELPATHYKVHANNNTFRLAVSGGGTFTITVTPGNYTTAEFLTQLKADLELGDTTLSPVATYDTEITANTHLLKITRNSGEFTVTGGAAHFLLGLASSTATATSSSSVLTLANVHNIDGANACYLLCDTLSQARCYAGDRSSAIAKIQIKEGLLEHNYYQATTSAFIDLEAPTFISKIDIELIDSHGHAHDLNGAIPSMTLCFTLDDMMR